MKIGDRGIRNFTFSPIHSPEARCHHDVLLIRHEEHIAQVAPAISLVPEIGRHQTSPLSRLHRKSTLLTAPGRTLCGGNTLRATPGTTAFWEPCDVRFAILRKRTSQAPQGGAP